MTVLDAWPGPLGGGANSRTSPLPLSGTGNERWRVDLPSRRVGNVSVGANGLCFVTSEHGILALDGPVVRWAAETVVLWGCVLLGDGLLVTAEQDGMVVREQLTGSVVAEIEQASMAGPVPMAPGRLVFVASRQGDRMLCSTTLTGAVLWEHRIHASLYPPLVLPDRVIVTEDTVVRAFDGNGSPVWSACGQEFRAAPDVVANTREAGSVGGHLVGLPGGNVLVPVRGEVTGYLVVDPRRGEVHAVPAHLPPRTQVVPVGDRIVLPGWPDKDDHGDALPTVTAVAVESGEVVLHHRVRAEVHSMVAGANGLVAVAVSPTWERWAKYHGWPGYDLRDDCYVLFLDEDGVREEWHAGLPITGPLAVGADGDLLVPVAGQLVSLE